MLDIIEISDLELVGRPRRVQGKSPLFLIIYDRHVISPLSHLSGHAGVTKNSRKGLRSEPFAVCVCQSMQILRTPQLERT